MQRQLYFELRPEDVFDTSSRKDEIDELTEFDQRVYGCELIQEAGILLKMPQVTMATAQVLLHRFYFVASLKEHQVEEVAMGALFLAGKMEEVPKKLRDVINVFHHLKQKRAGRPPQPLDLASDLYWHTKDKVIAQENAVLRVLGYHLLVEHPHKFLLNYLHILGFNALDDIRSLRQRAWNYLNDALRMWVCVRYAPEVLAAAAIYLAARDLAVSLPADWWLLCDAAEEDLTEVSRWLCFLYTRPKAAVLGEPGTAQPSDVPPAMHADPPGDVDRTSSSVPKIDRQHSRSRSQSPTRGERERSREQPRERDRNREREHQSRDRDRDRNRDRDRERDKGRDRDRDRDRRTRRD